ncbi:hypothetical protein [Bartonella tamiae]|uniref:Uncharacterized protein n=1 Tax=Bartonella tamiae Th239 TaxID=1094558 RepID=J0QSL9_9HYPH|nr:hypothetical protein [Bartonella tamiae]EJF88866.1 hypothetical protein ME5_01417 [Bartonella tamiae Th239]EJF94884.1 hypothetical protein MEG_00465 [Bartonella tamiae Th307]
MREYNPLNSSSSEIKKSLKEDAQNLYKFAERLLDMQFELAHLRENTQKDEPRLTHTLDDLKTQLDHISLALILEYKTRQKNEHILKKILKTFDDHNSKIDCKINETGRLLMQEIRSINERSAQTLKFQDKDTVLPGASSNIDRIIEHLQKAREKVVSDSPHLFA